MIHYSTSAFKRLVSLSSVLQPWKPHVEWGNIRLWPLANWFSFHLTCAI